MRVGTRRAVRALGIVAAVLVIVVGAGVLALRSPTLAVPSQGLVLSEVTVINPGRDRRAKQTVSVEGETIARIVDSTAQGAAAPTTRRFAGATTTRCSWLVLSADAVSAPTAIGPGERTSENLSNLSPRKSGLKRFLAGSAAACSISGLTKRRMMVSTVSVGRSLLDQICPHSQIQN